MPAQDEFPGIPAIHAALEASKGDRQKAAQSLGVVRKRLLGWMKCHGDLNEVWKLDGQKMREYCAETPPPGQESNAPGVQSAPPDTSTARDLAMQSERHRSLAAGLDGMRISKSVAQIAYGLSDISRFDMQSCMQLLSGGMVRTSLIIQGEIDKATAELDSVREMLKTATLTTTGPDGGEEGTMKILAQRETNLMAAISGFTEAARRGAREGLEAFKVQAVLRQKSNGGRPAKAGFTTPGAVIELQEVK